MSTNKEPSGRVLRVRGALLALCIATLWAGTLTAQPASEDPFGDPPSAAPPTTPAPAQGAATQAPAAPTAPAEPAVVGPCGELSQATCAGANRSFLLMALVYVVVAVAAAATWSLLWSKRGASRLGLKFVLPLAVAAIAMTVLIALAPFSSENFVCCLHDPSYSTLLLLGGQQLARGLLLGLLPTTLLYMLTIFVVNQVRR